MLLDYARILLRRWWLVILPVILIVAVTLLTARAAPVVTYQVTMSFGAGFAPEPIRPDAYNFDRHYNWLASEYTAQGFSLIVSKGVFADNVTKRLTAKGMMLRAPLAGAMRFEMLSEPKPLPGARRSFHKSRGRKFRERAPQRRAMMQRRSCSCRNYAVSGEHHATYGRARRPCCSSQPAGSRTWAGSATGCQSPEVQRPK